jgi:hypothetical protein
LRGAKSSRLWCGAIRARPGQATPISGSWRASGCSATSCSDNWTRSSVAASKTALEQRIEAAEFKPWLNRYLGCSLWQLEQHHQVEDHHYFPLFRRVEPRLAPGFELLEADHVALHTAIGGVIERVTAVLATETPGPDPFRSDLARFRDAQIDLGRALIRHLHDEEDLVIPLLLERVERFDGT